MSRLTKLVRSPSAFWRDSQFREPLRRFWWTARTRPVARRDSLENALRLVARDAFFYQLDRRDERARSADVLSELFFELVDQMRPAAFIEAGAKTARASLRARKILGDAPVVAFEGNPYTFRRFNKRLRRLGIDYRNLALSSQVGLVSFYVRRKPNGTPSGDGRGSLVRRTDHAPGHVEFAVPSTTLDAALSQIGARSCALWIDAQGATDQILGGAADALGRALTIYIEVEIEEIWPRQWCEEEVCESLAASGFLPVARDFRSPVQHSLVFVRRELLSTPGFRRALGNHRQRLTASTRRRPVQRASQPSAPGLGRSEVC